MTSNYNKTITTKRGWTKQPNAVLHDKELTSDAKVILYELLSISGDFHISESGLSHSINISLARVKKAVKLLKDTGYIEVFRIMNNGRLAGYYWKISDVNGTYRKYGFQTTEKQSTEKQSTEKQSTEKQSTENLTTENQPLYQRPKVQTTNYQHTKNQELPDEHTKNQPSSSNPSPAEVNQESGEMEEVFGNAPIYNPSFSSEFSSEANASPLQSKKPGQGEQVISQKEYMYQQFLKKYPKRPSGTDLAATRQAFFDIPDLENIFDQIMAGVDEWCNSVDWNKEGGKYITKPLNFIITQKWEEIPRGMNMEIDPELVKHFKVSPEVYR